MNYYKIMNGIANADYPPQQKHQQHQQQKCADVQPSRLVPFALSLIGTAATATANNEIITTIHPHDVLCCGGRKGSSSSSSSSSSNNYREHDGNMFLRTIISKKQKNYLKCSIKEREREKSNLIKSVIDEVKGRNPPGRFLKVAAGSSWTLLDKKDCLAKISHALFDKVDRLELKQKKQKNKMMIKNYLLSAAARVQAEELRMQSISSQQQRSVQQQQQRKVAPLLSQLQPNKRFVIQDNIQHYNRIHQVAADQHLHLAQMQRRKEIERQEQQEQQEMIKQQHRQHNQALEVQELHTRSQQLQEMIQLEQQRQLEHHLQLHQQEMQRKIELENQEQEHQNERHQHALEEQERHTRYQKLSNPVVPLKLEHQRQLELIHEEQQKQLKQHVQFQLERKRKLQQQQQQQLTTQLRQQHQQQHQHQHQHQQYPQSHSHSAEDVLHFITRSRSNTETTLPLPPPQQPQEVGSNSFMMSPTIRPYNGNNNNEYLNNKKDSNSCSRMPTTLDRRNACMINKQRNLSSILFAAVPNKNKNDYGNLVSAPNSYNKINNSNGSNRSNAAAVVGVSDNINHTMPSFSVAPPPKHHHPTTNNYGGYASSDDDSKMSLVF